MRARQRVEALRDLHGGVKVTEHEGHTVVHASDYYKKMRKLPKSEVQYSDHGHKDSHCSICIHYETGGHCDLVAGKIKPGGWCNRFLGKKK